MQEFEKQETMIPVPEGPTETSSSPQQTWHWAGGGGGMGEASAVFWHVPWTKKEPCDQSVWNSAWSAPNKNKITGRVPEHQSELPFFYVFKSAGFGVFSLLLRMWEVCVKSSFSSILHFFQDCVLNFSYIHIHVWGPFCVVINYSTRFIWQRGCFVGNEMFIFIGGLSILVAHCLILLAHQAVFFEFCCQYSLVSLLFFRVIFSHFFLQTGICGTAPSSCLLSLYQMDHHGQMVWSIESAASRERHRWINSL